MEIIQISYMTVPVMDWHSGLTGAGKKTCSFLYAPEISHIAYLRNTQVVGFGKQVGGHPEARGTQELVGRSGIFSFAKSVILNLKAVILSVFFGCGR